MCFYYFVYYKAGRTINAAQLFFNRIDVSLIRLPDITGLATLITLPSHRNINLGDLRPDHPFDYFTC
jgi:hypothetical protein